MFIDTFRRFRLCSLVEVWLTASQHVELFKLKLQTTVVRAVELQLLDLYGTAGALRPAKAAPVSPCAQPADESARGERTLYKRLESH